MKNHRLNQYDSLEHPAPEKERLTVRIPLELKELLEQAAEKRDTTVNKIITHILVNWFQK